MELKFVGHSESINDGIIMTCEKYTIGSYEVLVIERTEWNHSFRSVRVCAMKGAGRFVPAIYDDVTMTVSEDGKGVRFNNRFEIQTTSWGGLKADEFAEVVKYYSEALEVVRVLEKIFCGKEA